MVKQYLAAVLKDLIGEYVLNISKENLKLAALKGKIKLDNVELDGDYIGSHVISALGLQGFGVLSCYAKSLEIHVPWKNLDEPTSLEIHGMHLVCVPLLPTTATRMYYGGGISAGSTSSQSTFHDVSPRCSLRTRAKRSVIARFERNFFSGRIPGEGPQIEKEESDSSTLNYNGRRQRYSISVRDGEDTFSINGDSMPGLSSSTANNGSEHISESSTTAKTTLKEKITNKIYRNLISSINDVHIRFEVPEGALDTSLNGRRDKDFKRRRSSPDERLADSDQNSFAFGVVLHRFSVQNVSEDVDTSRSANLEDKSCKTIEISNMSMYWDDMPSFLLTESDSIKGLFSVPVHKLQRRIADAMNQMIVRQDPGEDLRVKLNSLNSPARRAPFARKRSKSNDFRAHEYICTNISQTMHTIYTTETSGNTSYLIDILPSKIDIDASSQQYRQYQLLKNAVLSYNQRFDTMLHGRPKRSPLDDPKSWWRYAIKCVQHRPNSRPWSDVRQIINCRQKYISLVVKNLESETDQSGFHGGLSWSESRALLELENFLPIETLLAFHLLALRAVFDRRSSQISTIRTAKKVRTVTRKKSTNSLRRLLKSVSGSKSSSWRPLEELDSLAMSSFPTSREGSQHLPRRRESTNHNCSSAIDESHRDTINQTKYSIHQSEIRISLIDFSRRTKIVTVEIGYRGNSYNSGDGGEEYICDILRFEVYDFVTSSGASKVLSVAPTKTMNSADQWEEATIIENCDADTGAANHDGSAPMRVSSSMSSIEDPLYKLIENDPDDSLPDGVVCRVNAVGKYDDLSLSLVAHPATIVWNNACADAVAQYFYTSTPDVKSQFLYQLRSAATPGAHRRQLELLFPTSLNVTVDIHAPKIWVPVSSTITDGALYLDAGKLKIGVTKLSKTCNTRWGLDLNDIQIRFLRDNSSGGSCTKVIDLASVNRLGNEIIIVYPFHIVVTGVTLESVEIPLKSGGSLETSGYIIDQSNESIAGEVTVEVAPIRLNLVDVEVLAKAVGRFYAAQIIRLKTKTAKKQSRKGDDWQLEQAQNQKAESDASLGYEVTFCLERIEVALESYTKTTGNIEKRSRSRNYLATIHRATLQQRNRGLKQFSRLAIGDASIVQLTERRQADGRRVLRPGSEPQHHILGRNADVEDNNAEPPHNTDTAAPSTPNTKTHYRPPATPRELRITSTRHEAAYCFIRACHYHDGDNHVDEIEFDVLEFFIRVTPTSISDLTKATTRLFELIRLGSKEMERKVHEGRRQTRAYKTGSNLDETLLPRSLSLAEDEQDHASKSAADSSVIYRVTFKDASLFVGRPASEFTTSRASKRGTAPHDYVIQTLANASLLVQSIENADASGSKTAHLSCRDLSASISDSWTAFGGSNQFLSPSELDLRAVYRTVEEGIIVSQGFSFDCESLKFCVLSHDMTVILSITRKVIEKLSSLQAASEGNGKNTKAIKGIFPAFIRVKEKGSGIATDIRLELSRFSIVSVHSFDTGQIPFLDLNADMLKLRLDGVSACLTGDLSTVVKLDFNHPISAWEHVVEPFRLHSDISLMPDEHVYSMKSDVINVNFTSDLLRDLARINRSRKNNTVTSGSSNKNTHFTFTNCTGIDVKIGLVSSADHDDKEISARCVKDGECARLCPGTAGDLNSISLHADHQIALSKLPLKPSGRSVFLYKWPSSIADQIYELEPVVESVVQNQRLRSSVTDVFSLDRGMDLLSSTIWSPSANDTLSELLWQKPYLDGDAPEFSDMTCRFKQPKESIRLPGREWVWVNDWEVEINDGNDADGWEYSDDFETFKAGERRLYKRGDACRRRRWIRHRMPKPHAKEQCYRLKWELNRDKDGCTAIKAGSHITLNNKTALPLTIFGWCPTWNEDKFICIVNPKSATGVPIQLASTITHVRLASPNETSCDVDASKSIAGYVLSDRVTILPSSYNSDRTLRTAIMGHSTTTDRHGLKSLRNQHFVLRLSSIDGVCDIRIEPALTIVNLLPCEMQYQLGESVGRRTGLKGKQVVQTEETSIAVGKEASCVSVDCRLKPHISVRLPGYRWSAWNRIVNRQAKSQTWLPLADEEATLIDAQKDGTDYANEHKTVLHLDHKCTGGTGINIIMSVEPGHSPVIRVYAQYWIVDKSGFGMRFCDNFDMVQKPEPDCLRQSFLALNMTNNSALASDMKRQGCEWSIGMNGMSLFFSKKERVSFSVVHDEEASLPLKRKSKVSRWSSFIDISKAISKTVLAVDDENGKKRFELAYDVTICPTVFSRTMMIQFFPRYQIANLLSQNLYIAQDGVNVHHMITPQSWIPLHWDHSALAPKIRLSCEENGKPGLWTQGCIPLDQVGITAIRIPMAKSDDAVVAQVEVRLATKKQSCSHFILIWSSVEKANPLYTLRNNSRYTIFCCQPLVRDAEDEALARVECFSNDDIVDEIQQDDHTSTLHGIARKQRLPAYSNSRGSTLRLIVKDLLHGECVGCNVSEQLNSESAREFVYSIMPGQSVGFGFDDPELPHILEFTCSTSSALLVHGEDSDVGRIDLDMIGSKSSVMLLDGDEVRCEIKAEQSTKVITFSDSRSKEGEVCDVELVSLALRVQIPDINVSFIGSISEENAPREFILITTEGWICNFSQTREGLHEFEVTLDTMQADNFIFNAEHQVLIYVPRIENETFVHFSIVRQLTNQESTLIIRYAALRVLELDISLDRKTAEALAAFLLPLRKATRHEIDTDNWMSSLTLKMSSTYSKKSRKAPRDVEKMIHSANSSRVYIENLQLHPIRLSLTFTQEWLDSNPAATEDLLAFQLIRGTTSIVDAPLTFTSFLVGNAFEAPQTLRQIIVSHYNSQLTSQILPLLFNMAILKAPVEFVSNVGSGVVRFFYEPINALVYSPEKFVEGLELGTHHLARGVFTGVVKGCADLTYLLNNNLVTLADEAFADTRRAYQKQIESSRSRTIEDSLSVAGGCISRGFQSGTAGMFEQPAMHMSRHGSVGLVTGVGKALVGAVVKPVVGVGDAAVVLMNHVGDAASEKVIVVKETKRMRKALPMISTPLGHSVKLIPYDNISAKVQRIVTGGESVDDIYLGHVTIPSHLIIASAQCLWVIDDSREPWCISWDEISHFSTDGGNCLTITVFSSQGPHSFVFTMSSSELEEFNALLSMQKQKMGNVDALGTMAYAHLPGMESSHAAHIFGSMNTDYTVQPMDLDSDAKLVERCKSRVGVLSSSNPDFFIRLDQEAWLLVNSSTQLFTGLSSRRCVLAGILNGANKAIQIKSATLIEGGSECYIIPSREYDKEQGTLEPGGAVIIFGWGAAPSLLQPGRVLISIETNVFSCVLSDQKGQDATTRSLPGYKVGLLEKSYDEGGWWAKYWMLIKKDD